MEINEKSNSCEQTVELIVEDAPVTITTSSRWGDIIGNINNQTDLQSEFGLYRKSNEQDIIDNELKKEDENLQSQIISETTRITNVEDALSDEIERAVGIEQQLAINLTNEVTRATSAEEALDTRVATLETDNKTNKTNISLLQDDDDLNKGKISLLEKDNVANKEDIAELIAKNFLQFVKILDTESVIVTDKGKDDKGIQTFSLEAKSTTPSNLSANLSFFNNNPQQGIASNILLELDEENNSIILYNYYFSNGEMTSKSSSVSLSADEFKIVNNKLTLAKTYLTTADAESTYLKKTNAQLTYASKAELMTETTNRTKADSDLQTSVDEKVDKVSDADKVYGTDSTGEQTTYDINSFGKVDDITYNSESIVSNKIAKLDGFLTYSDEALS